MTTTWVPVANSELATIVEIETEEDGSLPLTSITHHFPDTKALKFDDANNNKSLIEVTLKEGSFLEPAGGWGVHARYIAVNPDDVIKPGPRSEESEGKDMVLLRMKLDTSEAMVRNYFKDVEVVSVHVMQSRNCMTKHAFIKFGDKEVAKVMSKKKHLINGAHCSLEENFFQAKGGDKKIYVSLHDESISSDDLLQHFQEYGDVEDVFIPKPWRHSAVVTFSSAAVAQSLVCQEHKIRGVSLYIRKRGPPKRGLEGGGGKEILPCNSQANEGRAPLLKRISPANVVDNLKVVGERRLVGTSRWNEPSRCSKCHLALCWCPPTTTGLRCPPSASPGPRFPPSLPGPRFPPSMPGPRLPPTMPGPWGLPSTSTRGSWDPPSAAGPWNTPSPTTSGPSAAGRWVPPSPGLRWGHLTPPVPWGPPITPATGPRLIPPSRQCPTNIYGSQPTIPPFLQTSAPPAGSKHILPPRQCVASTFPVSRWGPPILSPPRVMPMPKNPSFRK